MEGFIIQVSRCDLIHEREQKLRLGLLKQFLDKNEIFFTSHSFDFD